MVDQNFPYVTNQVVSSQVKLKLRGDFMGYHVGYYGANMAP